MAALWVELGTCPMKHRRCGCDKAPTRIATASVIAQRQRANRTLCRAARAVQLRQDLEQRDLHDGLRVHVGAVQVVHQLRHNFGVAQSRADVARVGPDAIRCGWNKVWWCAR